ncbi:MAG: hypothetical protein RML38_03725 [Bacteroidia bacterium]|nr:hypothetical protein [Bacteroidia bacterium]
MGVPLWAFRLRSCPQGRRASGFAIASVLRFAPHRANARPPHASRRNQFFAPPLRGGAKKNTPTPLPTTNLIQN